MAELNVENYNARQVSNFHRNVCIGIILLLRYPSCDGPNIKRAKGNSNLLLDKDAERILLNGELIDSSWDTNGRNSRFVRIVYEGRYWQCKDTNLLGDTVLLSCAALPK